MQMFFRDLFENRRQFHHFQNYLTGLIVLDNKSLANITRCVLESADKPAPPASLSEAPRFQEQVDDRRRTDLLLRQTKAIRGPQAEHEPDSLSLEYTSCASTWAGSVRLCGPSLQPVGDDASPLAHDPVRSPVVGEVPCVFPWISGCIGAMKN